MAKKLTTKQQRFVDAFDGNATEAAKFAGYSHPMQQGNRLLSNVDICLAIAKRETKRNKSTIADRQERQEFWTEFMRNTDITPQERFKASELLGRSEADFTDIQRQTGPDGKDLRWKIEIVDPKESE